MLERLNNNALPDFTRKVEGNLDERTIENIVMSKLLVATLSFDILSMTMIYYFSERVAMHNSPAECRRIRKAGCKAQSSDGTANREERGADDYHACEFFFLFAILSQIVVFFHRLSKLYVED